MRPQSRAYVPDQRESLEASVLAGLISDLAEEVADLALIVGHPGGQIVVPEVMYDRFGEVDDVLCSLEQRLLPLGWHEPEGE